MTCERVREQLTAYLDGELEGDRGSAVRGHLRGCEACRVIAADEAALRDGLRALPPLDPPASLWLGVQRQLADAEVADAKRPAWRRALARWMPRAPYLGLVGAAAAAAIALVVIRSHRDDGVAPTPVRPHVEALAPTEPIAPIEPITAAGCAAAAPAPPGDGDFAGELAAEPGRVTQDYANATSEMLALATQARSGWASDRRHDFDSQLATLRTELDAANGDRACQKAYRKMMRFLQRSTVRDDVALGGGMP